MENQIEQLKLKNQHVAKLNEVLVKWLYYKKVKNKLEIKQTKNWIEIEARLRESNARSQSSPRRKRKSVQRAR